MKRYATAGKRASAKAAPARKNPKHAIIGRLPVVILPLEDYERMAEDMEMLSSKSLPRRIAKAREEVRKGQVMTLAEVKAKLRFSGK